ncbi:hypothetical protein AX774_g4943 [Zancudomyces culisetae]|uniref:Ubiquinol-cytochrome C reductase hinge domain-containing protein n=1 Tax=Zancudomyces culisetae TaxID=1213189 RepID=A0A1R1PKT8_ZANCU|nr:hypothetical protein AX774_g4943 [Zancudomyces culisetae]|eukprot:OMH81598.1 hypothetical protein AX774_g4943 [Zancudomyces culisetae]
MGFLDTFNSIFGGASVEAEEREFETNARSKSRYSPRFVIYVEYFPFPMKLKSVSCAETTQCVALNRLVEECTERVNNGAHEVCAEEFYHFVECVDHCVSHL